MAIAARNNTTYGGNVITQKYAPLENIGLVAADAGDSNWMLSHRMALLQANQLLGPALSLGSPNWNNLPATEAGRPPPLIVISTNRSAWIDAGFLAAQSALAAIPANAFTGVEDLRALVAYQGQQQSPAIYCPSRVGNRSVYLVVNAQEYQTYRNAFITNPAIEVVAWRFNPVHVAGGLHLVGFGASRFAAIEFAKDLRRRALAALGAAPWDSAWVVDDNVVGLTNFGAGLALVEAAIGVNVAAGFSGAATAEPFLSTRGWARNAPAPPVALPASNPPGILQQMVLWNVQQLDTLGLNVSPAYIDSGEDVSLSRYFDRSAAPAALTYLFYSGIGIRKEVTTADNSPGANALAAKRAALTQWVTNAESMVAAAPPPPITLQPPALPATAVSPFVVNQVLPNSLLHGQAGNISVQQRAKSHAVEQLTCAALGPVNLITPATRAATFQVNGAGGQQLINGRALP
jgi:hypothetical protein